MSTPRSGGGHHRSHGPSSTADSCTRVQMTLAEPRSPETLPGGSSDPESCTTHPSRLRPDVLRGVQTLDHSCNWRNWEKGTRGPAPKLVTASCVFQTRKLTRCTVGVTQASSRQLGPSRQSWRGWFKGGLPSSRAAGHGRPQPRSDTGVQIPALILVM